jgi:P-type Ca2+ transporter type 2C
MNNKEENYFPWSISVDEVFEKINSSKEGLSQEEVDKRFLHYGRNTFKPSSGVSPFKVLLEQFKNPLIFVLVLAAVLTSILSEWIDTGVILLAVFVNTGLGFYREYRAENAIDKLISYIKERARVFRDGREEEIDSETIVPGDIIHLSYGARIPADARIIDSQGLRVDEAILTGESMPVKKENTILSSGSIIPDRLNMVFAGTLVIEGRGVAVVTHTGKETELGKIATLVGTTKRAPTPIKTALSKLAWFIFAVVLVIVLGMFILGVYRGESILDMLLLASAVSVGAVPEALPIALTVILAVGAEAVASKNGIIRNLAAAETLGSASVIMTDKTGTLTEAKMKLISIESAEDIISKKGPAKSLKSKLSSTEKDILTYASSCVDVVVENPESKESDWNFSGHPFEVNIAKVAVSHGIDLGRLVRGEKTIILPFNSTNKFSISSDGNSMIVMGAPDILLSRSSLEKDDYVLLENSIHELSDNGYRLIGIAKIQKNNNTFENISPDVATNLEFMGLLVFFDPIRKEVPDAIKKIESYGTRIIMLTGDLKGTAISVAKELGWEIDPGKVLTGIEVKNMSDEELTSNLDRVKIYARVTPEDKLRIGKLLRAKGEIVAMTGDGVNDAPSLKAMDIGVALGSGSDVAKSVADIVLLDDNFKTIALAIDEGRRILANIRKVFVYLMSNCLDEVILIGGSLLVSLPLPLTALQIIWVNFFTGSLPALAFAFDENFDNDHSGKMSISSIFTNEIKILTFGIGILSSLLLFILYYVLLQLGFEVNLARAILFICFASYILVVAYSFRSLHKPLFSYPTFSNKQLNKSIIIAFIILIITMVVPAIRNLFDLSAVPLKYWSIVIFWLIFNILLVEITKLWFRQRNKKVHSFARN